MSQRLKRLPANQLMTRVKQLQDQIEQQKAAQIAGSHNVVLVRTVTGNTVDFNVTAAPNSLQQWKATFVPESGAFANLGFVWHVFWQITGTVADTNFFGDPEPLDPRINYLTVAGLNSGSTDTFTVQVIMYTVGPGTITIEKTI